jgi:hypothetical protein
VTDGGILEGPLAQLDLLSETEDIIDDEDIQKEPLIVNENIISE